MDTATQNQTTAVVPCNNALRARLIELREQPGWSNNIIAKRAGINTAVVSQYLNADGCKYPGDVTRVERAFEDLLENEARRRASGVETIHGDISEQVRVACEYIRKTSDIGVILAEAGEGKTRAVELYAKDHPTAIHYRTTCWTNDINSVQGLLFDLAGKKDYDGKTRRVLNTVRNLRGSERLIIVDDAHKLTRPALQWWFDFHDATLCPIAFVGTFELLDKLEDDPQRFSRVGLHFEIRNADAGVDRALLKHMIKQIAPKCDGESTELVDLCEQVAKEHGHYRSVHKQLKVAVEVKLGSKKTMSYADAFRAAHTMLVRNYHLN